MIEINIPGVIAEVKDAFLRYQRAVDTNDVETMNTLFWKSPYTVRFGQTAPSSAGVASFRRGRTKSAFERILQNTVITTFGRDFAATNTETVVGERGVSLKPNLIAPSGLAYCGCPRQISQLRGNCLDFNVRSGSFEGPLRTITSM